ncbi:penicillin-binding transpeptidase domain-containing protein [Neptunicella marina]|uniref:Peptidoglycan D,D-transpeptidase FtsI n=1 Tax=Neptunicella marina TaxID=2125989 RepID=A0A8J6M1B2_9ALTE|nr:penicillin-binding transpeptidase domain-containing protein [Neptunicella marina]MBC3765292.1 peptidoglycan glycosyltransferase FtsI [Neptunicella marina]
MNSRVNTKQAKGNIQPRFLHWRFMVVMSVVILVFVGLAARAAFIQVIAPDQLIEQGDNRTLRTRTSAVHRGMITDRNGEELAVSVPVQAVWADPKIILEKHALDDVRRWHALAEVLGEDADKIMHNVADKDRRFVYIQRQVTPAMAEYVDKLDIPGVYLRRESRRYYPTGEVSAQLIGFTNIDDVGIEGIERLFEERLNGTPDTRRIRRDGKGRQVEILAEHQGERSKDLQLTIDQRIQALAYREIKTAIQQYDAAAASAVVVDVNTGEILAMVNGPSFNPNNRRGVTAHRIRNRAITDAYEPGSVVKPVAVLSALEFGSADLDTVIDTNPGWMRLGGAIVKDGHNYGKLTLEGIIKHSSNMGTSKLALSVPKNYLIDMYYEMGLVGDTGTNLIGESSGIFHDRSRWSEHELATLSFGYNLTVTPVQIARMYSIIGSGGIKRPLSIIKGDIPAGERVLTEKSARAVTAMMEHVLDDDGTAPKAQVNGYRVAGKTGTSRKAIAGGYGEEYVNFFAGIAPVSNPQVAVVVLIDEPGGDLYYGGLTAAPVFSKIMSGTLQMLNIAPDDKPVSSLVAYHGEISNAG